MHAGDLAKTNLIMPSSPAVKMIEQNRRLFKEYVPVVAVEIVIDGDEAGLVRGHDADDLAAIDVLVNHLSGQEALRPEKICSRSSLDCHPAFIS